MHLGRRSTIGRGRPHDVAAIRAALGNGQLDFGAQNSHFQL